MKKFLVTALVASLMLSMAASVSAMPEGQITPLTIAKVGDVTPVIDGKYDPAEGWGDAAVSLEGDAFVAHRVDPTWEQQETSKLDVYYRWDNEYLYWCVVVGDSEHYNINYDGGCWNGDSSRFDIKTDLESEDAGDSMKYWLALNNDGTVMCFQEKAEIGMIASDGDTATDGKYKIVRDEATKTTTYEAAFKWSENVPDASVVGVGYEFNIQHRIMEQNEADAGSCNQAIAFPGYDSVDGFGTKWWIAELGDVPVVETEPVVEETVAETVAPSTEAPAVVAPQTFDAGIIAAVAAVVSAAGYAISKKR